MTRHQILWASAHSWFYEARGDGVIVKIGSEEDFTLRYFDDYKELRAWAMTF